MRKPKGFDDAKAYTDVIKLPAGGYVVEIKKAVPGTWANGNEYLEISFDICEGEYKDFYKQKYENDPNEPKTYKGKIRIPWPKDDGSEEDNRANRRLKTNINGIEDSNEGFTWDWDESKLAGLKSGLLFRNKEYDFNGHTGFWTEPVQFYAADKIRSGDYRTPKDYLLKKDKPATPAASQTTWETVDDDDLPFWE